MVSFAQKFCKGTPLSVVFGFYIYLATPVEELIKRIRGRTTLVAFRDLPGTLLFRLFDRKMAPVEIISSRRDTCSRAEDLPPRV